MRAIRRLQRMTPRARRAALLPPPCPTRAEDARMERTAEGCRREMAAFDAFPPPVRKAIALSAFDVRAERLHRDLAHVLVHVPAGLIAQCMLMSLGEVEERSLAIANRDFRLLHKRDLPHVAAGATILR